MNKSLGRRVIIKSFTEVETVKRIIKALIKPNSIVLNEKVNIESPIMSVNRYSDL